MACICYLLETYSWYYVKYLCSNDGQLENYLQKWDEQDKISKTFNLSGSHRVGVDIVESLFKLRLKLPGFINFLKFNLGMFPPSQCWAETFAVAEILTCSSYFCKYISCCSLLYGRPFNKIYEIYHLKQTNISWIQNLNFFGRTRMIKFFLGFCARWYVLNFFWRKIYTGYPSKIFVKNVVRGNAVQMFFDFPAKSLSIFRAKFLMKPL